MSSSTYYFFGLDGMPVRVMDLGNGWGSAPVIWRYIVRKYTGSGGNDWMTAIDRFWSDGDLYRKVDDADRLLLHMTFDRALLPRAEFARCASLLRSLPLRRAEGGEDHWETVSGWLEELAGDESILGFGIRATSVSEDPWVTYDADIDRESPFDARRAARVAWEAKDLIEPARVGARLESTLG